MQSNKGESTENVGGVNKLTAQNYGEKIADLAVRGEFVQAEKLREELLEYHPMELGQIVNTAEIIEEEKTRQLDKDHTARWHKLYDALSSEEINAVFYSLKVVCVEKGKLLTGQGRTNDRLLFIEKGRVSIFYKHDTKNKHVIQLGPGDILGDDTFFNISLNRLSAGCTTDVEVRVLSRKDASKWQDSLPGLYEKVADFATKYGKSSFALQQKNSSGRKYERYHIGGMVTAYVLDNQQKRTSTYFRGGIGDISRSGISFSMKCSKKQTARALLNRSIDVLIEYDDFPGGALETRGKIVRVTFHLHSDYTVHAQFESILDRKYFYSLPFDQEDTEDDILDN